MPNPSFSRLLMSSTVRWLTAWGSRMVTSWILPLSVRPPAPSTCENSVSPTLIENLAPTSAASIRKKLRLLNLPRPPISHFMP